MRKSTMWVSDQVWQKSAQARGLKRDCTTYKGAYQLCSYNTAVVTTQLICVFVFTYADCDVVAQL